MFSYSRIANYIFFIDLELNLEDGGTSKSVFRVNMLNLEDGKNRIIDGYAKTIEEVDSQIAVQMVFLRRELDKQYTDLKSHISEE